MLALKALLALAAALLSAATPAAGPSSFAVAPDATDCAVGTCHASDIPILVISLPDHAESHARLLGFVESLGNHSIRNRVCRTPGINGRNLPATMPTSLIDGGSWQRAQQRTASQKSLEGHLMGTPTVGLTLAHALAWQRIVAEGWPMAIVAEDDIRYFSPEFDSELEMARRSVARQSSEERLDLLQLQSCSSEGGSCTPSSGGWAKPDEPMSEADALLLRTKHGPTQVVAGQTCYCMGMYLITGEGARRALRASLPLQGDEQMDGPGMQWWKQLRTGMMGPPIAQCAQLGTLAQGPSVAALAADKAVVAECDADGTSAQLSAEALVKQMNAFQGREAV